MNLDGRAENRACSRASSISFVFATVDMNRLDAVVHLTISTQNF